VSTVPSPTPRTATIPRLQELEFLGIAATAVGDGATYDEIRRALIDFMAEQRERLAPSGNHAGHAGLRMARHEPHRYMWNATEALSELMRLGWVDKAPLPTSRTAAPLYATRTFRLTDDGRAWVGTLRDSGSQGYDQLLPELVRVHPQFGAFLRLLGTGTLLIPTANWTDAHNGKVSSGEGRETYMRFLAARASDAVAAGATGWRATPEEILAALHDYIDARLSSAERRRKVDPYPRSRDFVGACEEGLVAFALRQAGVSLDYISHEIVRRWTKTLGVANFSYHVPAAPALRLWATADFEFGDDGSLVKVRRRTVSDYGDAVIEALPGAYELARRRTPGNSWVPVYQVRAAVCSKLGLGDPIFDTALIEHLRGAREADAPFSINLDPAEYGNTPPTERPLLVPDRAGRMRVFRVMTLVPRDRKEST
jgi:hypothetical protein